MMSSTYVTIGQRKENDKSLVQQSSRAITLKSLWLQTPKLILPVVFTTWAVNLTETKKLPQLKSAYLNLMSRA